ncbi:hypothetical protein M9Y10_037008 [Tritrichomonas musculus]|uniref:Protein kinase domain-containing protein n=1 Tax=Tritrichomonas musculus TaxID=1915356 RepID=A0ABR2GUD9_9EUKA
MTSTNSNLFGNLSKLHDFINNQAKFQKEGLKNIAEKYNFFLFFEGDIPNKEELQKITKNIRESKIIVFDQKEKLNEETNKKNLIIGFEKTIIIHELSSKSSEFLQYILSINEKLSVIFLSETKVIIEQIISIRNKEIFPDIDILEEMQSLTRAFKIRNNNFWSLIIPSISCYLINNFYLKKNKNRITQFILDFEKEISQPNGNDCKFICIDEDEYVELRSIGNTTSSRCVLIFYMKRCEIYVMKQGIGFSSEIFTLFNREKENYEIIRHPCFPKFFGIIKGEKGIIIEYIKGRTLDHINELELSCEDKIFIIFELILVLKYFRDIKMIYRDLKPNNVMIDENKTVVLIDFDRLIKNNDKPIHTKDLGADYAAPEVLSSGKFSYESDIYSFGKMIGYIIETDPCNHKKGQISLT